MEYRKLKSGTDIRGIASPGVEGESVNLTDEVIVAITAAFLPWLEERCGKHCADTVVSVGHDSRISADRISRAVIDTLTSYGVHVIDCGLSSTPAMFMTTVKLGCDAAVQITASHHPFNRNGLKFFTREGGLDSADITKILENAQAGITPEQASVGVVEKHDFMEDYAALLRDMIIEQTGSEKPLLDFRIVVDAGNGAGGFYAYNVLLPLGADITGSQFLEPDGMFPNHIPNPENKAAMDSVSRATVAAKADLGIIFDTDVDRASCVDCTGKEINRNRIVALASAIALEGRPGGTIVTDSITSDGLKVFIEDNLKGKHHRFKRGYKNVINEAVRLNSEGVYAPLAIETSGHAAFMENYFLDDGAYLITKIIIKMAKLQAVGLKLEDIIGKLQEPKEECELRFKILAEDFRAYGEETIAALYDYAKNNGWEIAPDNYEGIRVSLDGGWFLLRLSVHDPIMPMNIESNNTSGVHAIAAKLLSFFEGRDCLDITPLTALLDNEN